MQYQTQNHYSVTSPTRKNKEEQKRGKGKEGGRQGGGGKEEGEQGK